MKVFKNYEKQMHYEFLLKHKYTHDQAITKTDKLFKTIKELKVKHDAKT